MAAKFFQIEMLPAKHGDCLWIEYGSGTGVWKILIDGGPIGAWKALEARLAQLPPQASTFELVVLSHVDTDHVDGLVRMFAPKPTAWNFGVKAVWFNGWQHLQSWELGGNQGEYFSALLSKRLGANEWNLGFGGDAVVVPPAGSLPRIPLADDFVITLLSPSPDKLEKMRKAWEADVKGFTPGDLEAAWEALAAQKKYLPGEGLLGSTPEIDRELAKQAKPDQAAANGSAIAFLAEFGGMSCLFLADAHPDIVCESLRRLARERGVAVLDVDAVKISHHGSKGNTNDELLSLVKSPRFLISTNGAIFRHPDDETIKRIIKNSLHQPPTLYFNYESARTAQWKDAALQRQLNYRAIYRDPVASDLSPLLLRLERD